MVPMGEAGEYSRVRQGAFVRYGNTPGQLEGLPPGSIDVVLSSPPYAASPSMRKATALTGARMEHATGNRQRGEGAKHEATLRAQLAYGATAGQLGAMPVGERPTPEDGKA